ncbi:hypothetical protein SAMN02745248_00770 [Hathewaya proteolytica DSM 3090]|uniref:Uncharacterized protein n=1 Tax=Hathewaya proteolytica DSM 3090 TaxID=1121331 RepID=A0A1M6LIA6_9CLOT|nr:hypothetical protein [Hathewaya proteolytica]SHJ70922.1 hypothetical protein SAMN02745248_00770 [Hathewaya proteolytica DSM 3090]
MKKRNLKFALLLQDGKPVRSLEELKTYYDIDKILAYFQNGQLERWLEQNEYDREYQLIQNLKRDIKNYMEKSIDGILLDGKEPENSLKAQAREEVRETCISEANNEIKVDSESKVEEVGAIKEPMMVKEDTVQYNPSQQFSINPEATDLKAPDLKDKIQKEEKTLSSIFRKPSRIDDSEIYGNAILDHKERFPFKNKLAKNENNIINQPKSSEFVFNKNKISKISDDDFFKDDFFMDDSSDIKESSISESMKSLDNEIRKTSPQEEKKKINFGFGNFNNKKDNDLNPNPGTDLNIPSINIEDSRKQLLELKKKSVFSKLKAEKTEQSLEEIAASKVEEEKLPVKPVPEIYENKIESKIEPKIETKTESKVESKSPDKVDSSDIDIEKLIEKINLNVEKNARLMEETDSRIGAYNEEKMTIEVNPKLNVANPISEKKVTLDSGLGVDFEKLNSIEKKRNSNDIDETVKSYKGTVYNQEEYEGLLKRRVSSNTRLRVVVSFNGLRISETNKNIEYIGINKPTVILISQEVFNCDESEISFSGVRISAENSIMVICSKLDNCTFDKTKIKKGISDIIEKYPSIMKDMKKTNAIVNSGEFGMENEITIEKYISRFYDGQSGESQVMATVQLKGLRIFTDLSMGVISTAFYVDDLGKIHDISDIFSNMESIDIFKRDVAIGIEFMALITDETVEAIEKEQNKKYQSTIHVLQDIFSKEEMYSYLEYVMIAPVKIFKQNEIVNRIDQAKIIEIMNIDTGIPYIYDVFTGPEETVKKDIIEFIESAERTKSKNGIQFKGVSIECLDCDEEEENDTVCYEFKN